VRIRRAAAPDVPVLADIVQRAYGGYVERIGRRPGPMDDDYEDLVRGADVFVAEIPIGAPPTHGVAGLIVLGPADDHVVIANVAVDPDHQHAGVGRALLAYAEEFALEQGVDEVRLFTHVLMTENQRLYRRLGYRETGIEIGDGFERVHMSKRLVPRTTRSPSIP
jgi:ribosomal protein S18 acetylase RimI-like enzyme